MHNFEDVTRTMVSVRLVLRMYKGRDKDLRTNNLFLLINSMLSSETSIFSISKMVQRTLHAAYAKHVLREHLVQKHNALTGGNDTTLPPLGDHNILGGVTPDPNQAICIFGAGAAGLSAALFLSHIGFKNIWVLEATSRVGGRAYTHNFTSGDDCNHNYYDIGAMRIPDISTQLRYNPCLLNRYLND